MIVAAALVATNVYQDFSIGKDYMKERCESQPIVREAVAHCVSGAARKSVVEEKPVRVCRPLQYL